MSNDTFDWADWAGTNLWVAAWGSAWARHGMEGMLASPNLVETEVWRLTELARSLSPDAGEILRTLWQDDPTGDFEERVEVARRLAA